MAHVNNASQPFMDHCVMHNAIVTHTVVHAMTACLVMEHARRVTLPSLVVAPTVRSQRWASFWAFF